MLGVQLTEEEPSVADEVAAILSECLPGGYVSLTAQEAARGRATMILHTEPVAA